jgi:hypothetical protein
VVRRHARRVHLPEQFSAAWFSIVPYLLHLEKRVRTNLIPTEHSAPNPSITYVLGVSLL